MREAKLKVLNVAVVGFAAAAEVGGLWAPPHDAFITYHYAKHVAAGQGFTFALGPCQPTALPVRSGH
jgi:hypothetical protein